MRLRNIKGADEAIQNSPLVIKDYGKAKGNWKGLFGNNHPVRIEIGMGKGRFITTLAKENPDINFVGIERYSSVLLRALQRIEEESIPNLLFLCVDARNLGEIFETGEVEKIYLNFSDPWPKDRHAKRRLPSREFLSIFNSILKKEGRIEFKTDNRALFDFGVEEAALAGWTTEHITYDLHRDDEMMHNNILTEYEEKFSKEGKAIYKYIIYK